MIKEHIILGGLGYYVEEREDGRSLLFTEASPVWGFCDTFILSKYDDINNTPGIWYLYMYSDKIAATNIYQSIEWASKHYGKNFEPFKKLE